MYTLEQNKQMVNHSDLDILMEEQKMLEWELSLSAEH